MRGFSGFRVINLLILALILISLAGVVNAIVIDLPYPVVSSSNSPYKFFNLETVVVVKNGTTYEIWGIDYNESDGSYESYKIITSITSNTFVTVGADGNLYFSIVGDGTYILHANDLTISKITTVSGVLTANDQGVFIAERQLVNLDYYSIKIYYINYTTLTESYLFTVVGGYPYSYSQVIGFSAYEDNIFVAFKYKSYSDYKGHIELRWYDLKGNLITSYNYITSTAIAGGSSPNWGGLLVNKINTSYIVLYFNGKATWVDSSGNPRSVTISNKYYIDMLNKTVQYIESYNLGGADATYNNLGCLAGTNVGYYIDSSYDLTTFTSITIFGAPSQERTSNIILKGNVSDELGNKLSNVTITIKQGDLEYALTTDLNGYYEASVFLLTGYLTTITASKTGYLSETRNITFYTAGTYRVDFTLINASVNYTVYGIIKDYPLGNPVANALVKIYNNTWNATTYSNAYGFYYFNYTLTNGTYTIKVEKPRFTSETKDVTLSGQTEYVIPYTFDNSGGGSWAEYFSFPITTTPTEYAQYKIEINGSTWKIFNASGGLKVTGTNGNFWNLVRSDGADIRVFNQTGKQLYFWIEKWDYTNQKAIIWVNLTAGSSELNIAYGNPNALLSTYNNGTMTFEFFDDMETWSGWTQYSIGQVSQSSSVAYHGTYSLKKDSYGDPNGGYKSIGKTLGRDVVLEFWVNRTYLSGANADRVGLIDDNGNGYGWGYQVPNPDSLWIDVRSSYSATHVANIYPSADISTNTWYRGKLIIKSDGTIIAKVYTDDTEESLVAQTATTNTTYDTFTRVYVFGGYTYFVDLIKVYKLADPADFGTPTVVSGNTPVVITQKLRVDFTLTPLYTLLVRAKTTLGNYLSSFQVSIENKNTWEVKTLNTENGTVVATLTPGLYSVSVTTSDNKFYGTKELYLNNDTSITIICSLIEGGSQTVQYAPTHAVTLQIVKAGQVLVGIPVTIKDLTTGKVINLTTDSYGSVVFYGNKTKAYQINVNNGEKVLTLYPASDYYIINIGGGFNISTNRTVLNFTNITLPVPEWLKLPVEVFLLLGCCCIVLAGTRSSMPFALLMATVLLGFGVWSGLTPHVPSPVVAVSAFITGLSFLRRGEAS